MEHTPKLTAATTMVVFGFIAAIILGMI